MPRILMCVCDLLFVIPLHAARRAWQRPRLFYMTGSSCIQQPIQTDLPLCPDIAGEDCPVAGADTRRTGGGNRLQVRLP